jgi:hypothetical protein
MMELSWSEFLKKFEEKESGSNIRLLIQDVNLPAFCVGIIFRSNQGVLEPIVRFFTTKDATDALQANAENLVSLNSCYVIPHVLYYPAGLLVNRVMAWMSGSTTLAGVPFNSMQYKTTLTYRDHKQDE